MAKIIDFKTRQILADLPSVPTFKPKLRGFKINDPGLEKVIALAKDLLNAELIFFKISLRTQSKGNDQEYKGAV